MLKTLAAFFTLALTLSAALPVSAQPDRESDDNRDQRRGPPPMSTIDIDGDGFVSLEEFSSHPVPRGDHSEIFSRIDSDADGYISEDELTSHKPKRKERRAERHEEQG